MSELQPIIDAFATSLREVWNVANHDWSMTLPAGNGHMLFVALRPEKSRSRRGPERMPRGLDARQLQLVDGAIEEKIGEPITVSMLSSVAGLSRSHFSHAFRRSVGRTPHAHVVRVRIERAMKMMSDTQTPLSEIALATGFSDQAHFSNCFRSAIGMTPTQWRRERCA